jgi:hypothetical protein
MKKKLFYWGLLFSIPITAIGQKIYLDEKSGNINSYNISEIKKITFNSDNVVVVTTTTTNNFLISDTRKITFQLPITNIRELFQINGYTLYPNPCTNELNIKGILPNTIYRINNLNGSNMQTGITCDKIDVSQLSTGIYFITLTNLQNTQTIKFIKQ